MHPGACPTGLGHQPDVKPVTTSSYRPSLKWRGDHRVRGGGLMRRALLLLFAAGFLYGLPSESQAQQRSSARSRVERAALQKQAREQHKARKREFKLERKSLSARDRNRYPHRPGTRDGPAFCRYGVGHPVFGLRWCHEKAFWVYGRPYWTYYGPYRPVYHRPYYVGPYRPAYRPGYRLHYASLVDLLGHTAVDLLLYEVLRLGPASGQHVYGYWYDPRHHELGHHGTGHYDRGYRGDVYDDALALQLYLDETPLAELTDFDRDGRVDVVLVNNR